MVKYENRKIYKIVCMDDIEENDIFIGSTVEPRLCKRMDRHRIDYKNWKLNNTFLLICLSISLLISITSFLYNFKFK